MYRTVDILLERFCSEAACFHSTRDFYEENNRKDCLISNVQRHTTTPEVGITKS